MLYLKNAKYINSAKRCISTSCRSKRKGGAPYIIHPLEVASYLINLNIDDDNIISAAILHDVVEDCNIENPYQELGQKYGLNKEIIDTVLLLTKQKDYKNQIQNKRFITLK